MEYTVHDVKNLVRLSPYNNGLTCKTIVILCSDRNIKERKCWIDQCEEHTIHPVRMPPLLPRGPARTIITAALSCSF